MNNKQNSEWPRVSNTTPFGGPTPFGPTFTNRSENIQTKNGIFNQPANKSTSDNMFNTKTSNNMFNTKTSENVFNKSSFSTPPSFADKKSPFNQVEKNPFNPFNPPVNSSPTFSHTSKNPFITASNLWNANNTRSKFDNNITCSTFETKTNYIDGRNGIFDFQTSARDGNKVSTIATKSTNENIHSNVFCDHCQQFPIVGVRYRCSMCANYDLCEKCLLLNENSSSPFHDESHLFYRLAKKTTEGEKTLGHFPIILNRANAIHTGVTCSGCQKKNPVGYLYKCQMCPNVHLCESCEAQGKHDINHPRTKVVGRIA